jgi:hypothetical protein
MMDDGMNDDSALNVSGLIATAPPPDVRQGLALPLVADEIWGCAPRWASGLKGEARTGGEAASHFSTRYGEAKPRLTSGGAAAKPFADQGGALAPIRRRSREAVRRSGRRRPRAHQAA